MCLCCLRVPGSEKREVAKSPFSMLHLAPTLLDAAELPAAPAFQGRSHWEQLRKGGSFDGIAISECVAGCTNPFRPENRMGPRVLSVRESRYKLVLHFDPVARSMEENLYDLEADPGEQAPLAPTRKSPCGGACSKSRASICGDRASNGTARARLQARLRELRLEWKKPANEASPLAS